MRPIIFFVFFYVFAVTADAQTELPDDALLIDTLITAETIRTIYSPREYYYLFIGRSPSGIMAAMDARRSKNIAAIPFTGGSQMSDEDLEKLWPLIETEFNRFIPSRSKVRGRKILCIDYVHTGVSLKRFTGLVQMYLSKRHRTETAIPLALANTQNTTRGYLKKLIGRQVEILKIPVSVFLAVGLEDFDHFGPYGSFDPRALRLPVKKLRKPYQEMRTHYRRLFKKATLRYTVCERVLSMLEVNR